MNIIIELKLFLFLNEINATNVRIGRVDAFHTRLDL